MKNQKLFEECKRVIENFASYMEGGPGSGRYPRDPSDPDSRYYAGQKVTADKYGRAMLPLSSHHPTVTSVGIDPDGMVHMDTMMGHIKFKFNNLDTEIRDAQSVSKYLQGEYLSADRKRSMGPNPYLRKLNDAKIKVDILQWFSREVKPNMGKR